ncbi:MAG: BON domain-containing protein [Smithellaceae bacterium]|nr:BON domain-containing protein [Smithellaceae bacterium]
MRHLKIAGIVMSLFVVLVLIGCAGTMKSESTGEYVDDSVITSKVKVKLGADDVLKAFAISVETYRGVVQLSGFVDGKETRDRAGELAGSVAGVKGVKNNLLVKTGTTSETAGQYIDDTAITSKIKVKLAADDILKSFDISVETYHGVVQLGGFVDNQETIDRAVALANTVAGVKSVKNNLLIK